MLPLTLAALACSGGGEPADGQVAGEADRQLFGESVEGEPCEILTTEMVAETVGVSVEDVRQSSMISCNYFWGDSQALIFFGVRVFDDVAGATEHLAGVAEGVSGEELAAMWDEIVEEARDRLGEDTSAAGAAEAVGEGAAAGKPEGISFEPAPDLGDRAIWEEGTSSATVQVANAIISLQGITQEGVEADRALTRRFVEVVVEEIRRRHSAGGSP